MTTARAALPLVLSVLALAGCGLLPTPTPATSSASAPASSAASSSAAPSSAAPSSAVPSSASPRPTATAQAATCDSLLDASTKAELTKKGFQTFDATQQFEGANDPFTRFVEYGGILCEYGLPNSDTVVVYGYGPLTASQSRSEQAGLKRTASSSGANTHGGEYYILDALDGGSSKQVYVFSPKGYWAFSSNGTIVDIQEIVPNAPVFY